jgi:DNA polymerase-3 subunit gamma/tau
MDVLEIDAASNTGVDNIRELRESARYAPSRDRYKVFIIDEVHMLSTSAFNALLKILEEPPSHVAFIMATTERHKLPATILSRCQQFIFRTISAGEIQAHLRQIAGREGIKIDERALNYIVKASEGSMRDAQSLMDQIISFSGQEIVDEDVRDVLGFIPNEILDRTIDALGNRDSRELLNNIGIVVDQGLNIQQYVREFIGRIRDLLLTRLGLAEKVLGSAEEKQEMAVRAERFSEQDLIRFFDMLLRIENELRYTSQPRFHLEANFIKLARIGYVRDIEDVLRDLKSGATPSNTAAAPPRPGSNVMPKPVIEPTRPPQAPQAPQAPRPPQPIGPSGSGQSADFKDVFRSRVEEQSPTTAVYLAKAARIDRTEDGVEVVMADATGFAMLDTKDHRGVLNGVASELLGKPISVSLIMKDKPSVNAGVGGPSGNALQTAKEEPQVKRFLEVFRGDIAQVKPAKGE